MKLVICVNHSYPHCGGSEKVVQQISESMVNTYGYKVTVLSASCQKKQVHNGVIYETCPFDSKAFLNKLKKINPDNIFVYSDCFRHWGAILNDIDNLPGRLSIALVGMNYMLSNKGAYRRFVLNKDKIDVVTHSDNYQDYKRAECSGIIPTVINNGVDLKEFDIETSFRKKYNIDNKIILCVSNFFPGKGQEFLLESLNRLDGDFTAVFISTTVNFSYARVLSHKVKSALSKSRFKSKFLIDIPREDTIGAFRESDVFAFPTQKEVAPLVVLESMACGLPWVAMPVGNIPQLKGGLTYFWESINSEGFAIYGEDSYNNLTNNLRMLLNDSDLRTKLGNEGRRYIDEHHDWKKIASQYNSVFQQSACV